MQPTVLIGLDGATFTALNPLVAAGHMPNLGAFLAEGVRAELTSTPHPLTPPAFTTMITGRSPGGHGIYDFLRGGVQNDKAFFTLNNFRDIQTETLWTLISRWGGRVISLNFPLAAPPPAVAGTIVPGLLSWRHMRRNVYPPEVFDEIRALPGFCADDLSCNIEVNTAVAAMPPEQVVAFIQSQILGADQQWFAILRHLMQTAPADLTAVIFAGVDKIQHACWRYLDPEYMPSRLDATEQVFYDLTLKYFRQLDEILGQIFGMAGSQANVFIASDHGFGPCVRVFHVNKWLEQQGYLKWPPPSPGGDRARKNTHFVHLDWGRTLAYVQSMATNGIHIRVRRGADDFGVPPEQYGAFRAQLVEKLRALRDPVTGQPFLEDILLREQAFPGPYMASAPDLTLVPFDHGFVSVLNQEPVIAVRPMVVGSHYPQGVLLGRGPSLRRGGQAINRQAIVNVAPTLLYSLGLPIPSDFEGTVITDVFDPAYCQRHPVTVGPATEPPGHYVPRASATEEDQGDGEILNRLRALGYVE